MSGFTGEQVAQLLKPINDARVLSDGKDHAHVSQQDILAHLIRVFGFGGFDIEVLASECVFEQPRTGNDGKPTGRYDVCYRSLVRLTVRDIEGQEVCHYENGSTATAQNQTRGDAHDLAYKSAISLSVKRAAIALGDQFGLSLYNKGQRTALVRGLVVADVDVQEGVEQQVALGHDEVDVPLEGVEEKKAERLPAAPEDDPFYDAPARNPEDRQVSDEQLKKLHASFTDLNVTDRDSRLLYANEVLGLTGDKALTSSKDMTRGQASRVIEAIVRDIEQPFPTATTEGADA